MDKITNKFKRMSAESKFVLILVVGLILYYSNTTNEQIVNFMSNLWFSIILSAIIAIIWYKYG